MTRIKGVVKWFDTGKGYGFIKRHDGGADVFVHYSAIENDGGYKKLEENDEVEFEVVQGQKGDKAQGVIKLT